MPPFPRSFGTPVQVRPAHCRAELGEFARWHHLAGVPNARRAGHNLVQIGDAGILATGLSRGYARSVHNITGAARNVPTVLAARTMALVAVADGHPIGGLSAGPSFRICAQLAVFGHTAVMQAAFATIKIHALAVLPGYTRLGVGSALLRHALTTARHAGAQIVYGQFASSSMGLTQFYRHCGMDLADPGAPLALHGVIDSPAVVAAGPGETVFHQVVNQ
ncbi:GNAT family N-acetyltransferase [Nocardia sp. NBC_01730]|uniref:GNAT family N-acetyltransferase n=1 Tax=Nocardia sp. NBC_01730 TaxID=2975998 RepID=UPI002E102542|nr:GNAT family N-acetyltransferase [Nocardia sp. NBC_01730]